ncbi:hypothetical protein P8452_74039 [Trifolium repens]|nr:hypothetical protein P8452_74039 [Trifolium repens]
MTVPKPYSGVSGKDDYRDNHSSIEKTLVKERGAHMEGERKPWLMYLSGKDQKNITFCSTSDPTKSYSTRIPDFMISRTRLRLCTVQHGWFVWENMISKDVSSFFLWNPLNLKKIMLPPLNHNGTVIGIETEGGRIYIAIKNFNYVYIYNIEEKSLVTCPQFSNLPENLFYSRWFMPDSGMTDTLKEEIGKSHQVREKESTCDIVYLKDAGDKAHIDYALPIDVVEVIANHLNVLDYLQFRATNKHLRLAVPPIQWRSSSSRFDDLSMCPLFVFPKNDKVFTFVHPKHGIEYKNMIKFPQGKQWNIHSEICCSKDGWLLLVAVNVKSQVFFNPFTKEVLPLPFHRKEIRNISITGKLGVIKATREEASLEVLEELQAPCCTCFNNFLVECDGNLLLVFESPFAKGVYIFKLNESTMTWTRVESLKNHMLFVGKTSFSVVANIPGMENKIYFPRFYGQSIVFYSLETNNYHTFQNEVVNFHHVREHLSGSWIQPKWSSTRAL